MTDTKKADPIRITDVIERHGRCVELVPMDPHFRDISVGFTSRTAYSPFGPIAKSRESRSGFGASETSWWRWEA